MTVYCILMYRCVFAVYIVQMSTVCGYTHSIGITHARYAMRVCVRM